MAESEHNECEDDNAIATPLVLPVRGYPKSVEFTATTLSVEDVPAAMTCRLEVGRDYLELGPGRANLWIGATKITTLERPRT